ncbi:unnamed protein product [Trichobilharzia szidati]|nr:unnamed protein product [Trichobilharzia szidati]
MARICTQVTLINRRFIRGGEVKRITIFQTPGEHYLFICCHFPELNDFLNQQKLISATHISGYMVNKV